MQDNTVISDRLTGLYREVGTLLLAFAPLDYSLEPGAAAWSLGGFIIAGLGLFTLSVHREVRTKP